MAVPTIDTAQSIIGVKQNETFAFQVGGTGTPPILYWEATSLPSGLSIDAPAEQALTTPFGDETTDTLTCAAHGLVDGDRIFFQSISGGSGLVVPNASAGVYYVRDKTTNTFKLAATATGAAIDFTTAITAGRFRKVGTSEISGSVATPGVYVIGLKAFNASAGTFPATPSESAIAYFTIGIEESSEVSAGSNDIGIDIDIDMITRKASLRGVTVDDGEPLLVLKANDVVLFNLRFFKYGIQLDPQCTDAVIAWKDKETNAVLVESTAFAAVGSGATAYFRVPVSISGDPLDAAHSEEEAEDGTSLVDVKTEIQIKQTVSIDGVTGLVVTTESFLSRIVREITEA